mmetsp:Transcript_6442/g.9296  ORF Transcript_6442/g.9296 Transcript_6442/m.9296 type:complete len:81 (+) Transcript_6442:95-337(+)
MQTRRTKSPIGPFELSMRPLVKTGHRKGNASPDPDALRRENINLKRGHWLSSVCWNNTLEKWDGSLNLLFSKESNDADHG